MSPRRRRTNHFLISRAKEMPTPTEEPEQQTRNVRDKLRCTAHEQLQNLLPFGRRRRAAPSLPCGLSHGVAGGRQEGAAAARRGAVCAMSPECSQTCVQENTVL